MLSEVTSLLNSKSKTYT